jgi:hypothetical protein
MITRDRQGLVDRLRDTSCTFCANASDSVHETTIEVTGFCHICAGEFDKVGGSFGRKVREIVLRAEASR